MGTVLDAAIGRYQGKQTGENSLFRTLHDVLQEGDVVLADRYYSGWFDLALPQQRGVEVLVRRHQNRPTDFRTGKRLGRADHLVCWEKPQRPTWMSLEVYESLPETLTLREVRVRVEQKGFRTKSLLLVTTLLDPEQSPAREIAELYRRRWQAELNLRSLKIVLQMDHLRCTAPHRVRGRVFHAPAGVQSDPTRAGSGRLRQGSGTLDGEFQRDAANTESSTPPVEHLGRNEGLVPGFVVDHRQPSSGQPPRPC